ncbi:hypothetical protein HAX54_043499 [Datura stramonium]|uniref:chalcone synthase n=1 Tax=Datura stramonium TaxID=4076 RepID=A0ABS8SPI2_DATST|nr:hypothetical protein [Datura stramonium]
MVFCTTSGVDMPGCDYQLAKLLGASSIGERLMMYQQGCSGDLEKYREEPCGSIPACRHLRFGTLYFGSLIQASTKEGLGTTGEGLEWGVLFGFGPGLTVETVVLHSVAT